MDSAVIVGLLVLIGSIVTSFVTLWKSRKETLSIARVQRQENENSLLQITNAAAVQNAQSWMQALERINMLEKTQTSLEDRIRALTFEVETLKKENSDLKDTAAADHRELSERIHALDMEVARLLAENKLLKEQIAEERRLRTVAEDTVTLLSSRVRELEQLNHGL